MVSLDAIINERGFTCAIIELLENLELDNIEKHIEFDEYSTGYEYWCRSCFAEAISSEGIVHKEDCQAVVLTQVIAEYKRFKGY